MPKNNSNLRYVRKTALRVAAFAGALIALFLLGYLVTYFAGGLFPVEKPPVQKRPTYDPDKPVAYKTVSIRPDPAKEPHAADTFWPPVTLEPPHVVVDTVTIVSDDRIVRLAYVDGLGHDDVCLNDKGLKYACGLRGRASLQNLVWNSEIICRPVFYPPFEIRYSCISEGIDLAEHQIAAGFARGDADGRRRYSQTQHQAYHEKKGAWNGDWTVDQKRPKEPALLRDATAQNEKRKPEHE